MKLWLLDADVVIDLLELDVLDKLVAMHQVHVASTVAEEVKHFHRSGKKVQAHFRRDYIEAKRVEELSADIEELKSVLDSLPVIKQEGLHSGELESLAILLRANDLTFCSCDAATIRALPFLDLAERGVSVEDLLRKSGLSKPGLKEQHTEKYFRTNLRIGKEEFVQFYGR